MVAVQEEDLHSEAYCVGIQSTGTWRQSSLHAVRVIHSHASLEQRILRGPSQDAAKRDRARAWPADPSPRVAKPLMAAAPTADGRQ